MMRTLITYDNLRNFFQTGTGQKHTINAAHGTEKLSFRSSASYSNTPGKVPNTKYEVVNFDFQAMIEAAAKIACLTITEKLVQPIKICTAERINCLIIKLDPAGARLKPYLPAGITFI
jgi:hypothetical protein